MNSEPSRAGLGAPKKAPEPEQAEEPSAWEDLGKILADLYSLPGNKGSLAGKSPKEAAGEDIAQVKGMASSALIQRNFAGPKTFLRIVDEEEGRGFSGEWWFDEELITRDGKPPSRIFMTERERNAAIRNMLKELLAIPEEWCRVDEIWTLDLPSGSALMGFACGVRPQKLLADLALNAKGNSMLVGRSVQVFFPTKNALWIKKFRNFSR